MRMRRRRAVLAMLGISIVILVVMNASRCAPRPPRAWRWLAHRGVHQTFPLAGVGNDTCTASRILPPTHELIENTLPSMRAAFEAGAEIVELDIHVTKDDVPMVFHDATLDCRTDGSGTVEGHTMAALRMLDVGYGYTADGGRTFPLRGKGVGLMPSLDDVLAAFPGKPLLLHFKTNNERDGDVVATRIARLPVAARKIIIVYGGERPSRRVAALVPEVRAFDSARVKSCLKRYLGYGWLGIMPDPCRNTVIAVPQDRTWLLWGWPRRFETRLRAVGTDVILLGGSGDGPASGVDEPGQRSELPADFGGWVWTNRIETTRR